MKMIKGGIFDVDVEMDFQLFRLLPLAQAISLLSLTTINFYKTFPLKNGIKIIPPK